MSAVEVVENELLDPASMPEPLASILLSYYDRLAHYRLLTYGPLIVRAVRELERPDLSADVRRVLRHLIVDEYQDVNPARERLVELLTGPAVELCVVGDDHQAIYQWRGSDVSNIVRFGERYPGVARFEITTNWRSRPGIIEVANRFSTTIRNGIDKTMLASRDPGPDGVPELVVWSAATEADEAGWIAGMIDELAQAGVPYRDIAVLARSRAAYRRLLDQFHSFGIPVQPGGRTGLFDQPEAVTLGHTFVWLSGLEWRDTHGPARTITDEALLDEYRHAFDLAEPRLRVLGRFLREWKEEVPKESRPANLSVSCTSRWVSWTYALGV